MGVEFSIIIPVYNVKNYLVECVESVINQKKDEFEYEIIIVDDGSTDGSGEICDKYLQRKNITVIHKENGGLGSARNAGIDCSIGDYIWFLDSDDYIEEDALEKLYRLTKKKELDIVFFGAQCFSDDYNPMMPDVYRRNGCLNTVMYGKAYLSEVMKYDEYYASVCLRVFRRDFLGDTRFCENILHEDEDFGFITTLRAQNVIIIKDKIYHRRYRRGSIMSNNNFRKRIEGYYYACVKIKECCDLYNLGEEERELCRSRNRKLIFLLLSIYYGLSLVEKKELKVDMQKFLKKVSAYDYFKGYDLRIANFDIDLYCFGKKVLSTFKRFWHKIWLVKKCPKTFMNLVRLKNKNKIILLGTPMHGNYGDHLIAEAELELLRRQGNRFVIECPMMFANGAWNFLKKKVSQEDVILISGGGWMGTLWRHDELFIRKVIEEYPNNRIIIMPQTVYYEGDDEFLESGKRLYASHKWLDICVRDQKSFEFLLNNEYVQFDRLHLVPDFAILSRRYIRSQWDNIPRELYGYCFRNDVEKVADEGLKTKIVKEINKYGEIIMVKTNIDGEMIVPAKRRKKIDKKFKEFYRLKLLVTDRLHAMIIAYLTRTPCLFIDNKTNKVTGVFEWIRKCGYIFYINDETEIQRAINKMHMNNNAIDREKWEEKMLNLIFK